MTHLSLEDVTSALLGAPAKERERIVAEIQQATAGRIWVPNPGPQTAAHFSQADELFFGGSAGGGKALALDTPLPTPTGWTTMRDVAVGDELVDETGLRCRVVATTPVMIGRPCYRVVFSDGAEIVADAEHQWVTLTEDEREQNLRLDPAWRAKRRANRPSRGTGKKPWLALRNAQRAAAQPIGPLNRGAVRTTADIERSVLTPRGANNHSIALAAPLQLPDAQLPIDPYLLGAWLGDGTSANSRICMAEPEMVALVAQASATHDWGLTKGATKYDYGIVGGFKVALRENALLKAKHIPAVYLRAAASQRIALLQGLMDTDGYATPQGYCEFVGMNARLVHDVAELLRSLGCKARVTVGRATLQGRDVGEKYRIKFCADFPAFRLQRKLARQKQTGFRDTVLRRYIVDVQPINSVPVRCVQVDSPSHMYLAGVDMVPTHNSDLAVGEALTEHKQSLIIRRYRDDAKSLAERMMEITGTRAGWNGQDLLYRYQHRTVEFGGCKDEDDKQRYKGRPHDLIVVDEVTDLLESQYVFIIGWNRSADRNQRCRIIATGNPPTKASGLWVIKRWAAWLDPNHPNPARDGELRWYTTVMKNGTLQEVEVDGPGPHHFPEEAKPVMARSRTFIRATLSDNPDLASTTYGAVLDALPAGLRRAYRDGKFDAALEDELFQVIPSDWVTAAQKRWQPDGFKQYAMTAMSLDPAGGGSDPAAIAQRYGGWYAPIITYTGPETRDGSWTATWALKHRHDNAPLVIDVGGGYAGGVITCLNSNSIPHTPFNGAASSTAKARGSKLSFANKRAEAIWRFREALDPDQEGGSVIALPDDPELRADLTAPTFKLTPKGILIESKDDLRDRLGRSTTKGDVVCMALAEGDKAVQRAVSQGRYTGNSMPQVVRSERMTRIVSRRRP